MNEETSTLVSLASEPLAAQMGAEWLSLFAFDAAGLQSVESYRWSSGSATQDIVDGEILFARTLLDSISDVQAVHSLPENGGVRSEFFELLSYADQSRLVTLLLLESGAPEWLVLFKLPPNSPLYPTDIASTDNCINGLLSVTRQISEMNRLRVSEGRLRAAIEAAEVGTWDFDMDRNECWWSPRTCDIWGIEYADTLPGDLRYSFIHPDDEERYRLEVDEAVFVGKPFAIEYRIVRPDGNIRWVLLRGVAIKDAQGRASRATGIAIDTTDRREAEERLRESRALLDAFMANAPVGMYLKDTQARYVLVNPKMAKVLGVSAHQALGRTAEEILGSEEAARIEAEERRAIETGLAQARDQYFPERQDNSSALLLRFPVVIEGQAPRIGGFAVDTTERLRAQAELERSRDALHQAEKLSALGGLLAGVAHELNNPLAVVVAHAELLEEELSDAEHLADVQKIRRAAERCAKIVETFLGMARQQAPAQQDVNINALIVAALDIADYGLRTSGVEVSLNLAADLPSLFGDPNLIQQLLANLIVNAHQVLLQKPSDRKLKIRSFADNDMIAIDIADNGGGIAETVGRRIFEPFYTTKAVGKGTGLGLSFSLNVAQAHGGTINLLETSTSGTTFRISLPASNLLSQRSETPQSSVPQSRTALARHALVADDEPDISDALARFLGRLGYRTTQVGSGQDARRAVGEAEFDLIISDLRMPGEDGELFFDWLQASHPALIDRLAFVTGDALSEQAAQFLARAGRPWLEKPFALKDIRQLLTDMKLDVTNA